MPDPVVEVEGPQRSGRERGSLDAGLVRMDNGTVAGPTREKVNGAEGCAANTNAPYNCVMLVPIASDRDHEPTGSKDNGGDLWSSATAFKITEVNSNTHNAQLLDDYIVTGTGTTIGWCRDCGGPVVIRLVW